MRIALLDFICYPKKRSTLSRKAEPPTAGLGRRRVWCLLCVMVFTLLFSKDYSVAADNSIPNLKLFAYNSFKSWDQFSCYNYIIIQESKWNYKARNGSHYGLGQMRNPLVLTLTPKEQIVWHMRYIGHRYGYVNDEPNACKAAEHLLSKGWH